jgi:hypothetical protein
MSMTRDARDTAASFYYLELLQYLRDRHLERAARGQTIAPDYWTRGEAAALEEIRRQFYDADTRRIFMAPDKAAALNDAQDFEARSTKMVEMAMLETHRLLVQIPWVGHPDYRDR